MTTGRIFQCAGCSKTLILLDDSRYEWGSGREHHCDPQEERLAWADALAEDALTGDADPSLFSAAVDEWIKSS